MKWINVFKDLLTFAWWDVWRRITGLFLEGLSGWAVFFHGEAL
jgi:hypothetical protein